MEIKNLNPFVPRALKRLVLEMVNYSGFHAIDEDAMSYRNAISNTNFDIVGLNASTTSASSVRVDQREFV